MENLRSLIVAAVIIFIIIAAGIYFYSRVNPNTKVITSIVPTVSQSAQNSLPEAQATQNAGEQVITITKNGFSPSTVTVKLGTIVKWMNQSGGTADVDSNPHPIDTSYPPMNFGSFSNGSSVQLVFHKAGTYGYHNQLHPSQAGTIVVQ